MTRVSLLAGVGVLALVAQAPIVPASAAPQPLGLVATIEAAPLVCENGKCAAVLATFCLQQSRLPPAPGEAYEVAPGADVRLVVTHRDGRSETLDGGKLLRFVSYTGFSSITAEIPSLALGPNVAEAVVEVGERVTLLPVELAGDLNPLSEDEIAMAVGPWRKQAEDLFDKPNPRSDANRLIARAISVLPEDWKDDGAAGHAAAWQTALAAPGRGFTRDGIELGRRMFSACKTTVGQSLKFAMRGCLERRLDEQQREINQEFWDQQGGV